MDKVLLLTILTIFLTAFIGTMIRYRTRDKCLKSLEDYFVTVQQHDGKNVWGRLHVYHNALELEYPSPHLDPGGSHFETSFILYQEQFGNIVALRRIHDELTPANRARRLREVEQTYHPNFLRRAWRGFRNMFNLLRDAFSQAISAFVGSMKKAGTSTLLATQDARLTSTAGQIIGQSSAYEPILEKYIGRKVVLEVTRDGETKEYCGILKDYSDKFITVLDIPVSEEHEFSLADPEQLKVNDRLDFEVASSPAEPNSGGMMCVDLDVTVTNKTEEKVHLCHAEGQGYSKVFDQALGAGEKAVLKLSQVPLPVGAAEGQAAVVTEDAEPEAEAPGQVLLPQVRLWIRASRFMDMVVPRSHGLIRHGAESIGQLNVRFLIKLVTP